MPIGQILMLVGFAPREAPEVLHLLVSLLKIATGDETDAKLDKFDAKATIFLNTLLGTARSTVRAVDGLDFGKLTEDEQLQARFNETVNAVKAVAEQAGRSLGDGEAETIAQNGWALERKDGTVTA